MDISISQINGGPEGFPLCLQRQPFVFSKYFIYQHYLEMPPNRRFVNTKFRFWRRSINFAWNFSKIDHSLCCRPR